MPSHVIVLAHGKTNAGKYSHITANLKCKGHQKVIYLPQLHIIVNY